MKHLKMLGLLAAVATASMVFASSASANPSYATSPAGTKYKGAIHATADFTEFHNSVTTISCNSFTLGGTITADKDNGTTASGPLSTLTIGGCNYPFTVLRKGALSVNSSGTVFWTGVEITMHGPFGVNCIYTTNNTDIGTITGGSPARLHTNSAAIPRTGHSAFCGSTWTWTGGFTFTTPKTLFFS